MEYLLKALYLAGLRLLWPYRRTSGPSRNLAGRKYSTVSHISAPYHISRRWWIWSRKVYLLDWNGSARAGDFHICSFTFQCVVINWAKTKDVFRRPSLNHFLPHTTLNDVQQVTFAHLCCLRVCSIAIFVLTLYCLTPETLHILLGEETTYIITSGLCVGSSDFNENQLTNFIWLWFLFYITLNWYISVRILMYVHTRFVNCLYLIKINLYQYFKTAFVNWQRSPGQILDISLKILSK